MHQAHQANSYFTKHAQHTSLTYSHSTNTLSIDTTKHTPHDIVLQQKEKALKEKDEALEEKEKAKCRIAN